MGTIGARARNSQATKAIASMRPDPSAAVTSRLVQPALFPRISPHTTPRPAPVTSARPGMSSAVPAPKLSRVRPSTSGTRMTPSGTLIQNIHCQARPSAIAPPATGPAMRARPVTPLKIPSAFPRVSRGNAAPNSAIASGITSAPPAP